MAKTKRFFVNDEKESKFRKMFLKRVTINEMAGAGVSIALLVVVNLLSNVMPKINGYAAFEPSFFVASLIVVLLPFRASVLTLIITPFLWFAFGQVQLVNALSFTLDYELPLLTTLLIYFNLNKIDIKNLILVFMLSLIAGHLKLLFAVISGVYIWEVPTWLESFEFNMPILSVTIYASPFFVCLLLKPIYAIKKQLASKENSYDLIKDTVSILRKRKVIKAFKKFKGKDDIKIDSMQIIHSGYTNTSYKLVSEGKAYQIRIPKQKFINWNKEDSVYKQTIKKGYQLNKKTGFLIKPWIEGNPPTIKEMDLNKKQLKKAIDEFHSLKQKGIDDFPWMMYSKYHKRLDPLIIEKFKRTIRKYEGDKKVVAHTDLHEKNMLFDGKKFTLIDFEYVALTNPYVDYALLYARGVLLEGLDMEKLNDFAFLNSVICLLWMESLNWRIRRAKKDELHLLKITCDQFVK